jgi:cell wall-associated NlpC family hydrolase
MMRNRRKTAALVLVCGLACLAWAQDDVGTDDRNSHPSKIMKGKSASHNEDSDASTGPNTRETSFNRERSDDRILSEDERLSVMAAALDSKIPRFRERDCSHLVHAIYQRAGFPYKYASSDDLYDGAPGFQREMQPEAGDLVVWRGHVGIVVRPSRHVFYSFLSRGPGINDYTDRYWKRRGTPRFYRYIKSDRCMGCVVARGDQ